MGIRKFLVLSTQHIHPSEVNEITRLISNGEWTAAAETQTGWFIWTGYWDHGLCPTYLKTLLTRALLEYGDIDYLLLDRDSEGYDKLPLFTEEWG